MAQARAPQAQPRAAARGPPQAQPKVPRARPASVARAAAKEEERKEARATEERTAKEALQPAPQLPTQTSFPQARSQAPRHRPGNAGAGTPPDNEASRLWCYNCQAAAPLKFSQAAYAKAKEIQGETAAWQAPPWHDPSKALAKENASLKKQLADAQKTQEAVTAVDEGLFGAMEVEEDSETTKRKALVEQINRTHGHWQHYEAWGKEEGNPDETATAAELKITLDELRTQLQAMQPPETKRKKQLLVLKKAEQNAEKTAKHWDDTKRTLEEAQEAEKAAQANNTEAQAKLAEERKTSAALAPAPEAAEILPQPSPMDSKGLCGAIEATYKVGANDDISKFIDKLVKEQLASSLASDLSPELLSQLKTTMLAKDFLKPKPSDTDYGVLDLNDVPEADHKRARTEYESKIVNSRATGFMATAMRGYRDQPRHSPYTKEKA